MTQQNEVERLQNIKIPRPERSRDRPRPERSRDRPRNKSTVQEPLNKESEKIIYNRPAFGTISCRVSLLDLSKEA